MSSYKTPGFSVSELAALRLWNVPDVDGAEGDDAHSVVISEAVDFEVEPTPVLTVEEIEAVQKQAYDEAFAQGEKAAFSKATRTG